MRPPASARCRAACRSLSRSPVMFGLYYAVQQPLKFMLGDD